MVSFIDLNTYILKLNGTLDVLLHILCSNLLMFMSILSCYLVLSNHGIDVIKFIEPTAYYFMELPVKYNKSTAMLLNVSQYIM